MEYATEREKMLQSTNSSLKREVDLLRGKSQQFSGTLSRHLSSIEQLTQDLLKTKGDLARAEVSGRSAHVHTHSCAYVGDDWMMSE